MVSLNDLLLSPILKTLGFDRQYWKESSRTGHKLDPVPAWE